MSKTAVLIVGAGPAGLTLAIELARRNVPFRLVDAAAEHFGGSRGKGLQPRTLEVFEDLGVLDEVRTVGSPYPPIRSYRGCTVVWEGRISPERSVTPDVPYPNIWLLPQTLTDRILRDRLAALGGRVELAIALVDATQQAGAVTATLRGPSGVETVQADYLVGADGGHSLVRRLLGIGFLGETRESERALVADLPVADLDRDHWHFWGDSPTDSVGLCPLAGTDLFQLQAVLRDGEDPAPTAEGIHDLFRSRAGVDLALGAPVWTSKWRANMRLAERFRVGRMFLAGDAAHVHSPAGGQGLNTSIQDAYNLGWKLAAVLGGAPDALLDTYSAERLPVAADVLGISTDIHERGRRGDADAYRRDDPELAQLHVGYRASALSVDDRAEPGPLRAGDRAPDAPCRDETGAATRLFEVFGGVDPVVLSFGASATPADTSLRLVPVVAAGMPAGAGSVVDHAGHIQQAYQLAPGSVAVVRPDGYLGLVTTSIDRLAGYLAMVAPTPAVSR